MFSSVAISKVFAGVPEGFTNSNLLQQPADLASIMQKQAQAYLERESYEGAPQDQPDTCIREFWTTLRPSMCGRGKRRLIPEALVAKRRGRFQAASSPIAKTVRIIDDSTDGDVMANRKASYHPLFRVGHAN